jgi:resolvase-like protein
MACRRRPGSPSEPESRPYDKLRSGDTLVVRWVDRLRRNDEDVFDTVRHFMQRGVVIRPKIKRSTTRPRTSCNKP